MELLATAHWVRHRGGPGAAAPADSVSGAITQIHAWNPRKEQVFRPEHIRAAWSQLEQQGWMRETKS